MLKLNNILKTVAISMLAAASFLSCAEIEDPQSEAVGYLVAPTLDVDITVQDLTQTKAVAPVIEEPSVDAIRFVVKDKDGAVKYDAQGLWSEALVLPVGDYTVEASYGSNTFVAPYFTGAASGSIEPLDSEVPALTVSLANSLICVELDPEFAQHFDVGSSKAVLKSGSASAEVGYGQWIYVPSGADLEVTMTGTTAGKSVSLTHSLSSPSPKVAYNLVCKKSSTSWPSITWPSTSLDDGAFEGSLYFTPATASNMSATNTAALVYQVKGGSYSDWTQVTASDVNGYKCISGLSNGETYSLRACVGNIVSEELSFTPVTFQSCFSVGSVTAVHNNNGNADVELSSTTMTANNMVVNLPAIIANLTTVTASGSFSSSNNNATGSFSSVDISEAQNASFENASDWPYLPQGTYSATVKATCTLNGATYTAETSMESIEVPAPEFSVTVSAETSYSRYLNYKNSVAGYTLDKANTAGTGDKVMDVSAHIGISNDILQHTNYSSLLGSVTLKYDGLSMLISENVTSNSIVPNTLASSTTIDGNKGLLDGDDVINQAWGSHSITASFTFNGEKSENTLPCHVTGLPYDSPNFLTASITMKLSSNASVTDWVSNGNVEYWSGRGYQLIYYYLGDVEAGNIFSPAFKVPESTNIKYSIPVCYFTTGLGAKTMDAYTGVTTNFSKVRTATSSITRVTSDNDPGIGKFTTITKDDVLVSNGRISISTDESKDVNAAENWFTVAYLSVDYR